MGSGAVQTLGYLFEGYLGDLILAPAPQRVVRGHLCMMIRAIVWHGSTNSICFGVCVGVW